jgi:predicted DNA-binding transcriptional regulator AlpA
MLSKQLRFSDLKARGIVRNWVTLGIWIKREGFPPGRLAGPNTRLWEEKEVADWLANRPSRRSRTIQCETAGA